MGKGDPEGGRPRKELTDELFETLVSLCQIMCTQDEICNVIDMDHKTLDARLKERNEGGFSQFYKKNISDGKSSLRRAQYNNAMGGNATMQVWLGKQYLDQSDKLQHTGADGGPLKMVTSEMTPKEAAEAYAASLDADDE